MTGEYTETAGWDSSDDAAERNALREYLYYKEIGDTKGQKKALNKLHNIQNSTLASPSKRINYTTPILVIAAMFAVIVASILIMNISG